MSSDDKHFVKWRSDQPAHTRTISRPVDPDERLFDQLVALKLTAADFPAQLDVAWRAGLFARLDHLLDADEWDFTDEMPSVESFKTLLRAIIHNHVKTRPGLGATRDGKIIASWRNGEDRLVLEAMPNDHVRWVASRHIGGDRISAAGTSPSRFLRSALQPYNPEVWFG
ncbi:MAG TPA: hypothetical protein VIJ94_01305 [Caulobacteraceae bacterium]